MALAEKNKAADYLFRNTNACDACRVRKRKCDGKAPCSYCVAKNQQCEFSERKKRGPKKRFIEAGNDEDSSVAVVVVEPSTREAELFDKAEAYKYFDVCWKFVHRIHPLSTKSKIRTPAGTAQKVQAYAALAYTSRLCGDKAKSTVYLNQARMLSGFIYDSPDPDSVSAMLMLGYHSLLTLDIPKSTYYSNLALQLSKMIPSAMMDMKLLTHCQLTTILSDYNMPGNQKTLMLKDMSKSMRHRVTSDKFTLVLVLLLEFHAAIIQYLGYNTFYPSASYSIDAFHMFDSIVVSEEARLRLFEIMNSVMAASEDTHVAHHMTFVRTLLVPLYTAVINWKSNHIREAMEAAVSCLAGMQVMDRGCLFGLLSHFPQICMLGSLVKLFMEQGQVFLAKQMADHIKNICNVMKPDLDFICKQIDDLLQTPPRVTCASPISLPLSPISPIPPPFSPSPPSNYSAFDDNHGDCGSLCNESHHNENNNENNYNENNNNINFEIDPKNLAEFDDNQNTICANPVYANNVPFSSAGFLFDVPPTSVDASPSTAPDDVTWITDEGAGLDVTAIENILGITEGDAATLPLFGVPILPGVNFSG